MVCKICAAMKTLPKLLPTPLAALAGALLIASVALAPLSAHAEKADRLKPLNFTSDHGGQLDVINQRTEFSGNVMLSKGSMLLRAERIALRETADGYHQVYANGQTGQPVQFHQGRDVPGESIEGSADQLEYDSRADTVRFLGNAVVRRMRGSTVADEVTGANILFDNRSEIFTVEGGTSSPHPSGRVRVVLMPRAAAAEAPGAAASGATGVTLQPSTTLQPRKPS